MVLIDDVLIAEDERLIINGIVTVIVRHIVKIRPARNEERHLQFIDNNPSPFLLLLQMIVIFYIKQDIRLFTDDQNRRFENFRSGK